MSRQVARFSAISILEQHLAVSNITIGLKGWCLRQLPQSPDPHTVAGAAGRNCPFVTLDIKLAQGAHPIRFCVVDGGKHVTVRLHLTQVSSDSLGVAIPREAAVGGGTSCELTQQAVGVFLRPQPGAKGYTKERETDEAGAVCRTDGDLRYRIFATAAGLAAIGITDGERDNAELSSAVASVAELSV